MLKKWSLFLLMFCVRTISAVFVVEEPVKTIAIWPVEEEFNQQPISVNGVIYKASRRYFCSLFDDAEHRQTLVYGAQGWVFPRQDVNLTLSYPSVDGADWNTQEDNEDYVITGYQVLLFTDGLSGSAYVNSGGLMEDNLSLTFISNDITSMFYRFWLYGAPRGQVQGRKPNNSCT